MDRPKTPDPDRRVIRIVLGLVVAGWASAIALMVLAVLFWDHPSA